MLINVEARSLRYPSRAAGDEPASLDALMNRVYYNLGNAFFDRFEYDRAIRAYRQAIDCDPADQDAWYNLGLCYGLLGTWGEMDWALRQVQRLRDAAAPAGVF